MIKLGDSVRVLTNPKGTLWEKGVVDAINNGLYLINFGYPLTLYGLHKQWYTEEELEKIERRTK